MKASVQASILAFAALSVTPFLVVATQDPSHTGSMEAPTGYDNETNGYLSPKLFMDFRTTFEEPESIEDGLGPVFNNTSCANCHSSPVSGGSSTIMVTRAGRLVEGKFVEHPGGSLVQDRAIDPKILEHLLPGEDHTFRSSLSVLGDGFIEAIADDTIVNIAANQPSDMRGTVIRVPLLEAEGQVRVARFGWKNQHASLESFAADAYLNEMGITSSLQPIENSSDGNSVAKYDSVPDPEDTDGDVHQFAEFMRSTKAPPRNDGSGNDNAQGNQNANGNQDSGEIQSGQAVFERIGCAVCHVGTIVTAPAGTSINGGAFKVPSALGNKTIHPFSDFLLHDVGTSDPIVQNGGPDTYNKVRTPPLWGLSTRTQYMHDGQSKTLTDAIKRHGGQAARTSSAYDALSSAQKRRLLAFLNSL